MSFYSQLFDYARDESVPIFSRAMTAYTRDHDGSIPTLLSGIALEGEDYARYLASYTWGSDSITRPLLLELGADTTEVDNFLSDTEYDRDLYRDQLPGLIDPAILNSFLLQFLDAATFHTYTTADHLAGYWQHMESDGNFVGVFMPYISENGAMAPVFRSALQQYTPDDTLGAFLDYYPPMRDLLRSTNSADNLLHLLLEDTAFSIDNIYALQYDAYGDDLVVAASVAAQTGNNMATLTSTVSNLGGSYLTIIDTIEKMVIGEQEMQLSEHHLYGSSRLGIKNYLPRQVYAYWNNTDIIPVADTGSLLSRRPWYSLEYNDVINGLALSPYGSTDQTTSGSQHLAGQRQYEMTNHLGNVLATLSDLPYKSEGEVLQFRVNPALRAVYDYYPFGSLKPGRYVSDTTENCVTMTQSRWVVKYRDSTVWNTGWVSAPATKPNLGIAQQITLSSIPGNGISIEIEDTAAVGGLMTAVQELSVTPNVRQDLELNLQVVSGTFVLRVLEEVNGTDVLLGSLTVSDAGGSDGTVSAPVSYSISILPSTNNVKLQVSSPITMGTVLCCAPRTMNGYWKKITVPYLEQENIVVTLCDSIGDKYRFGFNGQEKVNELSGIGNHNTAEFWEYDTRLGRRWNVDPVDQVKISNYAAFENSPFIFTDQSGNNPVTIFRTGQMLWRLYQALRGADKFVDVVRSIPATPPASAKKEPYGVAGEMEGEYEDEIVLSHPKEKPVCVLENEKTTKANADKTQQQSLAEAGKLEAQSSGETGKIYRVPGERTKSGKPYIGRTKNTPEKRGKNAKDGRERKNEDEIDTYDPKKPGQGSYKEQQYIDKEGGIKNLDNKRNEVSPEKMQQLENLYGPK